VTTQALITSMTAMDLSAQNVEKRCIGQREIEMFIPILRHRGVRLGFKEPWARNNRSL